MLEVKNISIAFGGLKALDDVSLYVEEGKIFSLIGPNGAGKTTLFNVVAGSLRADRGQVTFMGKDITGLKPHVICREGIARTFQLRNTFPNLTVFNNIMAGLLKDHTDRSQRREKVREIMEFLEIDEIAEAIVSNLSPLASKLVELARALATAGCRWHQDAHQGGHCPQWGRLLGASRGPYRHHDPSPAHLRRAAFW